MQLRLFCLKLIRIARRCGKDYFCSMKWIDTHTHLYLKQFNHDRDEMIQRAVSSGVDRLLLPNIDCSSVKPMMQLCAEYPDNCYPMIGLHPGSVKEDYQNQLTSLYKEIANTNPIAIGEIGLDLYWDKTYIDNQLDAFVRQLEWAKETRLPVVIHTREAFPLMFETVAKAQDGNLMGVFHCFTGDINDAKKAIDLGFYLGIGGVLTYKKSGLADTAKEIPLSSIVLETDAPYLPPVPYRGKRNESAYLVEVAKLLSEIKEESLEYIANITNENAKTLFKLKTI